MTTNLRLTGIALVGTTALFVLGCDSGDGGSNPGPDSGAKAASITSAQASAVVNQHVDELITGLASSTAALDTSDSTTVASTGIGSAFGSSSACPSSTSDGSTGSVPKSTTDGLDDFLRRVAKEAQEHVFRPEFVETEDGSQVVYKINPASACDPGSSCAEKLTQYPVRFQVTANADGTLNVSLLVGEARHNPATAVLGPSTFVVRANLAETLAVIRLYTDAENQQDLPDHLNGVLTAGIQKRGENDFLISGSILEKLDLLVGQAKGKPVAVTVAPTDPAVQVTLNSTTNTVGYSANVGAADVQVAGAAVCDDQCGANEKNGTFSGHLGGLSSQFTLSKGATELTFLAVGLGNDTSYVALNNDRLGTLDVNANNGRKLSVSFKKTAQGTLVTFDPALDVKLAMMLNKLSESLRVDMPAWLGNEIFEVMLGGAPKPSILIPAPTCDAYGTVTSKNEIQVATGNLTLTASSLASPVNVAAGLCLLPVDGAADDAHPFSRLQGGVCR